jgi:hypothetical protein
VYQPASAVVARTRVASTTRGTNPRRDPRLAFPVPDPLPLAPIVEELALSIACRPPEPCRWRRCKDAANS